MQNIDIPCLLGPLLPSSQFTVWFYIRRVSPDARIGLLTGSTTRSKLAPVTAKSTL